VPRGRYVTTPVDINAIVRDAIQLAHLDGAAQIALRASFFEPLPPVAGSPEQLVRAIRNLLDHARASLAGIEDAAIEIETEPDAELVAIRILDNGPGIPEDRLERIFDPFRAGEVDPDPKATDDAAGLSDALEILREHGGTLAVRSRPGEGACFVALLPADRR